MRPAETPSISKLPSASLVMSSRAVETGERTTAASEAPEAARPAAPRRLVRDAGVRDGAARARVRDAPLEDDAGRRAHLDTVLRAVLLDDEVRDARLLIAFRFDDDRPCPRRHVLERERAVLGVEVALLADAGLAARAARDETDDRAAAAVGLERDREALERLARTRVERRSRDAARAGDLDFDVRGRRHDAALLWAEARPAEDGEVVGLARLQALEDEQAVGARRKVGAGSPERAASAAGPAASGADAHEVALGPFPALLAHDARDARSRPEGHRDRVRAFLGHLHGVDPLVREPRLPDPGARTRPRTCP